MWRLKVRAASFSISAHASSVIGASSRYRLFMTTILSGCRSIENPGIQQI
ncbi:Uncharacterised protein [Mycobacteroides abscessus subsp. abscessus]|nr:Uncharacterised protein [Mycobacteroides abscessus subsp. abscessus]